MPSDLPDLVRRTIIEHDLVRAGDRVLAAVSGGADSVALLHLLKTIAPLFPFSLEAAHLDHGLRQESRHDSDFVHRLCARWEIPLLVRRADVPGECRRRRQGVEETAREVRREFLQEVAGRRDCRVIALGHHRGDQAETILFRLLRGSGGCGLAGMTPASGIFIRPLLGVGGQRLRQYLSMHGISWVEDASNTCPAFARNRIRHDLLPRLAEFNPRVEEALERLGRQFALEEEYWGREVRCAMAALTRPADGGLRLDRGGLCALHPALRARVLRQALQAVRGDLRSINAVHLQQLAALAAGGRPQADLFLPGAWAGSRYADLWLRRSPPTRGAGFLLSIAGPGTVPLPSGGGLSISLESRPQEEDPWTVEFDPGVVSFPLTVRSFRPGDRIRPAGMSGSRKVKEILMEARVEREARLRIPLLESGEILWIIGLRRSEGRRPPATGPVLRLQFRPLEG